MPSVIGTQDIIDRFVEILTEDIGGGTSRLQDYLDTITTAAGVSWTISAPPSSRIVASESWEPPERANSIRVYATSIAEEKDQVYNYGGPIDENAVIVVEINVFPESMDQSQTNTRRLLFARAVKKALQDYWRSDQNPAVLKKATFTIDPKSRLKAEGVLASVTRALGLGSAGQDGIDPILVIATCRQSVSHDVVVT